MRLLTIALAGGLALAGCGGTTTPATTAGPLEEAPPPAPSRPVTVSGSREARAVIGSAGGTLTLANGARLEIPPGALDRAVEITLQVGADGHAFGDRERQRPLGPMLAVLPELVVADGHEVVLSIPELPVPSGFTQEDLAFEMEEVGDARAIDTIATQTRWDPYPVRVESGRFVIRTPRLPGNRLQFGVAR